jgi:beta-galactosidase
MGWLRRSFLPPENLNGNLRVILHFEAVAGYADVYINGKYAGSHFDQYLPFEFDITGFLHSGDNELLVGVRHQRLFDKQSKKYKKMRTTYAHGSNTQDLAGLWQDVWLFVVPAVRIEDIYIKPLLDSDTLEIDVTVRNDTECPQTLKISGTINPTVIETPNAVPETRLLDGVMEIAPRTVMISAYSNVTVTFKEKVSGRLLTWSGKSPQLYTVLLNLEENNKLCDVKAERFGWRQFTIEGRNIYLNGEEIHLVGDICHPFGPYMFSRRFIISWYNLIKNAGGNAVRLHAQIYPKIFLDVADETGIMVLDETGIFGSCLSLNFEDETAWKRYNAHYSGLIKRDRNRPSVFGWSFGNELFAIFLYDDAAKRDEAIFYAKLFELGHLTRLWDTTRPFISCDGDEDLRGTLNVWSKHYGHGTPPDLSHIEKPVVIGENGGSYYARPEQLGIFNGEHAYESYGGRAEALGIDLYDNIRTFGRTLAYFSPSELGWFGLEQLPYGYSDFSRLPDLEDGIFFTRNCLNSVTLHGYGTPRARL